MPISDCSRLFLVCGISPFKHMLDWASTNRPASQQNLRFHSAVHSTLFRHCSSSHAILRVSFEFSDLAYRHPQHNGNWRVNSTLASSSQNVWSNHWNPHLCCISFSLLAQFGIVSRRCTSFWRRFWYHQRHQLAQRDPQLREPKIALYFSLVLNF